MLYIIIYISAMIVSQASVVKTEHPNSNVIWVKAISFIVYIMYKFRVSNSFL